MLGEGIGKDLGAGGQVGAERAAFDNAAHELAVLVAERLRIEMEERPIEPEPHQTLPGASPRARAIATSFASRRASARAAAVPSGVSR